MDDQRDYAEEAANRTDMEREGLTELAEERLMAAVEGLDLTDPERRTLAWLARWEAETIERVASVIEKARRS